MKMPRRRPSMFDGIIQCHGGSELRRECVYGRTMVKEGST